MLRSASDVDQEPGAAHASRARRSTRPTPRRIEFQGETLELFQVPIDGDARELALLAAGRTQSSSSTRPTRTPRRHLAGLLADARAGLGASRRTGRTSAAVWDLIDYPRLLFNTIAIALIGTIGTLLSCTLVAYGFARFRFPGRGLLFTLLIATIFLPAAVTIIPTYTIFVKLGWVGTWLPLLVPAFFANAYDVFLMRQYFLTIPTEMDEAAAIDGAGPFRTLWSVLLPQAWPVVIAVAIFHLVYSWNDFFGPLIYLSSKPELQPLAVGLSRFNGVHYRDPGLIQAGTLMTLVIPVVAFLLTQRFFTRGIVITGVEK